jgi:hypothetical protein
MDYKSLVSYSGSAAQKENFTVSHVILIRHTEFHIQPTSAGPGTRAHDTHGMPKSAQHFLV